ncbi:metallophosphoesterase family protein [Xylanibacter muris]|uniref:Nuclease SbcCD subunit D n=1 Tax=Xylanibacter muris TaxID=2736290 RepID=A0ABX2AQJ6_9BACT|nr:exonuclease subunit SbcD [Xylanibacter muris]NPD92216.1 exonuclease subunit SbcD [Xylanibacter muris]
MKILHTSDWHLGHTLYNYDRTEEHTQMLRQMIKITECHKPDAFIICGDIYHTPQPSAATQKMFTDALVEIHMANPQMTIIVTAGNHDSCSRHEIFRNPWRALKVFTVGNINKDSTDEHIIEIPDKGFIIAIPYSNERNIPEGFFQHLLDTVNERNTNGLPVVMTAHTTVNGCDFTGHDNSSEYTVGGIDCLELKEMGYGYDYLALGHIHHAQFIHSGKHNVRYSGSPPPRQLR